MVLRSLTQLGLLFFIGGIAFLLLPRDYDYHWDADLVVYRYSLVAAACFVLCVGLAGVFPPLANCGQGVSKHGEQHGSTHVHACKFDMV